MAVSQALENSAKIFNTKYACRFDFATFEARVEEFTFLRPNGGWIELYKRMFAGVYQASLEKAALGELKDLNGEAMLDDFEYTLIRPYVNEGQKEIKHKHYVGMDRITRLEYIGQLTAEASKNAVELFARQYKRGDLTLEEMRSALSGMDVGRVRLAAYVRVLEGIDQGRSALWRVLHPFKGCAEKRTAEQIKKALIEEGKGGEASYREMVSTAYETFEGYRRATENLSESLTRAKEELNMNQKMSDAMKESLPIAGFGQDLRRDLALRVESHTTH